MRVANLLAFEQQPVCTRPASGRVAEQLAWLESEDAGRMKSWREIAVDEAGSLRDGILLLD